MSLALLHFQPLENYPPVMNCIRDLEEVNAKKVFVLCTYSNLTSFRSRFAIHRFGNYTTSRWARYWTYLYFNISTFFYLCYYRPTKLLYYETYSCWPAYWYLKFFPATQLFIHFHEYLSPNEKQSSSTYYRYLLNTEAATLKKAIWISHTNEDRMRFFQQDYPFVRKDQCHILPNYPPAEWVSRAQAFHAHRVISKNTRMVYVGALGLDTTYIKEIAAWIEIQKGAYTLDIYCNSVEVAVLEFFHNLNSSYISIHKAIPYSELPEKLVTYDIGLVLYKGVVPNHIYSVPNKIVEYLSCGLQVFCSIELLSTITFKTKFAIENLYMINYKQLLSTSFTKSSHVNDMQFIFKNKQALINQLINNES
jgi:hypothetical protein